MMGVVDWTQTKLGEIVSFKTGKLDSNAAVPNGMYPFFTCSQETYRTNTFAFDTEAVLLAGNNANGIYPLKYFRGKFDAYQRTYIVRAIDDKILSNRYLFYALRLKLDLLRSISTGAATKFLTLTILRDIDLDLPPLTTQQRIVSILSAYDDLIENNTRRIAILEEMARRIYEEWFVHFRFPGHEKIKMVESELGLIPEGWRICRFSELLVSHGGGDWGSDKPNDKDTVGVSVIRGTDFDDLITGKPLRNPKRYIEDKSYQKRKLIVGDLIVENSINAKSRSAGKTLFITKGVLWRLGGEAIPASFCKLFRFKEPRLSVLAHMKMKSLFESGNMAFYQNVAANGIANFQAVRFVETECLIIPNNESLLENMLDFITNLNSSVYAEKNTNLRTQRDLLLPKLISGEIDVSEINISNSEGIAA